MLTRETTSSYRLLGGYDTIVVGAGIVSIAIAAVYWVMRLGFDDPIAFPFRAVALALFLHTFPLLASEAIARVRRRYYSGGPPIFWWSSYAFLWILGFVLAAVLGRLVPIVGISALPLLALVGVVSFLFVFAKWLSRCEVWRSLVFLGGCAAFAVWAAGVVWGRIYKNPLYLENFILNGNVHHDTMDVIATANMIRTYGVASNGLDGLAYVPWHWGSTWFFAQFAYLVQMPMLEFYQLAFPVICIPLFFGSVIAFAVMMRNRRGGADAGVDLRADFRLWGVFLAAAIGIIPLSGLEAMGVWTSNPLISDSYTFGVPFALLFFATCIMFYDSSGDVTGVAAGGRRGIANTLFALLGIPVGIVGLGYLKSSLMVLAFGLAVYAFIRLRLYRRPIYIASIVLTTLLVYHGYHRVVLPAHNEGLAPFDFLWSFVKPAWWPFFPIVHLFWSWLYIALRLRVEGIGTLADLKDALQERRILDVEVVAFIALLGLGPGLVIHIDGGSAFYFSDVQRWLSLGLLLSWLPAIIRSFATDAPPSTSKTRGLLSRLDTITVRQILIAFLLIPVVGSVLSNSIIWPTTMIRSNVDTRHALYPSIVASSIPRGLHGFAKLNDHAVLEAGLRSAPNYSVATGLRHLALLPESVRRHTALVIPQDQQAYWASLTRKGACTFQPFVAPALASIAMIDGMPPFGCTVSRYYGLGSYPPRTHPQLASDLEPRALCSRAHAAGLDQILMLTFDAEKVLHSTPIACPQRP